MAALSRNLKVALGPKINVKINHALAKLLKINQVPKDTIIITLYSHFTFYFYLKMTRSDTYSGRGKSKFTAKATQLDLTILYRVSCLLVNKICTLNPRKLYTRRNNNKVNFVETGRIVIANLLL